MYFDVLNSASEVGDEDGKLWISPPGTIIPVAKRVLWGLLEFDAATRRGYVVPVRADAVVEAVMNGDLPPLHECEEEDAWLFRRELREVAGHIDEYGNKVLAAKWRKSKLQVEQRRTQTTYTPIDDDDLPF